MTRTPELVARLYSRAETPPTEEPDPTLGYGLNRLSKELVEDTEDNPTPVNRNTDAYDRRNEADRPSRISDSSPYCHQTRDDNRRNLSEHHGS